jgi:hypothetical protein
VHDHIASEPPDHPGSGSVAGVMEEDRAGEQARVAARSVLANIESLDLDPHRRRQVVDVATKLSDRGGSGGGLDHASVVGMTGELKELLAPARGLTASTLKSWLDDIEPVY